jgi:hypothetical protein
MPCTEVGASEYRTRIGAKEIAIIPMRSGINVGNGKGVCLGVTEFVLSIQKRNQIILLPNRQKINGADSRKSLHLGNIPIFLRYKTSIN